MIAELMKNSVETVGIKTVQKMSENSDINENT